MDQHARLENLKAMLDVLHMNPAIQQPSTSATALNFLTEEFPCIRRDGDEVDEDFIDCTDAIERCESIPEREALGVMSETFHFFNFSFKDIYIYLLM